MREREREGRGGGVNEFVRDGLKRMFSFDVTLSFSVCLSLSVCLSVCLSVSLSLSHTHTHTHIHTHTHTHTYTHSLTHTHTHTHTHTLTHTHTHTHTQVTDILDCESKEVIHENCYSRTDKSILFLGLSPKPFLLTCACIIQLPCFGFRNRLQCRICGKPGQYQEMDWWHTGSTTCMI